MWYPSIWNLVCVMARHVWSVARDSSIGIPHLRELRLRCQCSVETLRLVREER
jgi:hypothetical protein